MAALFLMMGQTRSPSLILLNNCNFDSITLDIQTCQPLTS